jgi:hypothetical protein
MRHVGRHAEDLPAAAGEPLPRLGDSGEDRPGQGLRLAEFREKVVRPPPRSTAGVADDQPHERLAIDGLVAQDNEGVGLEDATRA